MEDKQIILPVRAKHFKNTQYLCVGYCAISKAARELFNAIDVNEGVDVLHVQTDEGESSYTHTRYDDIIFCKHKQQAAKTDFDDTIIFELELTPYGKQRNI